MNTPQTEKREAKYEIINNRLSVLEESIEELHDFYLHLVGSDTPPSDPEAKLVLLSFSSVYNEIPDRLSRMEDRVRDTKTLLRELLT